MCKNLSNVQMKFQILCTVLKFEVLVGFVQLGTSLGDSSNGCQPLWYNECIENANCCSGNCSRSDPTWLHGVCAPPSGTVTTTTPLPCQPLWFNECLTNVDCCSGNCHRGDPAWRHGVCNTPKTETTTATTITTDEIEWLNNQNYQNGSTRSIDEEIEAYLLSSTSEPLESTSTYTRYVKGLLFMANQFKLYSDPFPCTDLDPEKQYAIPIDLPKSLQLHQDGNEKDAIRICDLCPSLPLEKLDKVRFQPESGAGENGIFQVVHNIDYPECVAQCLDEPQCLAVSFHGPSSTCSQFNSTVGELVPTEGFTFVTVNQPSWSLKNWVVSQNTRVSINKESAGDSDDDNATIVEESLSRTLTGVEFLDCLTYCDQLADTGTGNNSLPECIQVSYDQKIRECRLFFKNDRYSSFIRVDSVYGHLSSFKVNAEPDRGSSKESWRFQKSSVLLEDFEKINQEESNSDGDDLKFDANPAEQEFDHVFNAGCKLQPLEGCNVTSGFQKCRYPENIVHYKNPGDSHLPICPKSRYSLYGTLEEEQDEQEKCFAECVQTRHCIGINWAAAGTGNGKTCQLLTLSSLSGITANSQSQTKLKNFYALRVPEPTATPTRSRSNSSFRHFSLSPIWSFNFYPGYQLTGDGNSGSREIPRTSDFEDCLKICQEDNQCERVSFDHALQKCVVTSSFMSGVNEGVQDKSTAVLFLKAPPLNSPQFPFTHLIGVGFSIESASRRISTVEHQVLNDLGPAGIQGRVNDCLMTCSNYQKNHGKSCDFTAVNVRRGDGSTKIVTCDFFNDDSKGVLEKRVGSEVFVRNAEVPSFKQSELDQIPFFQPSDFYSCFRKSLEKSFGNLEDRIYDLDSSAPEVPESTLTRSNSTALMKYRRRRGLLDAIKKGFQKIGNAFKGAFNDVKDTFVKTGQTIGKLFKGDFKGAKDSFLEIPIVRDVKETGESAVKLVKAIGSGKNIGESLLDFGTNVVGFVPIPGGKVVKGIAKALKPPKPKTRPPIDKKAKPPKESGSKKDQDAKKKKDDEKKDKDQAESCSANDSKKRPKRKAPPAGSSNNNKKRPLDCSSDRTCTYKTRSPNTGNQVFIPNMDKKSSSSCRAVKLDNKDKSKSCQFTCKAGYSESRLKPVCQEVTRNEARWQSGDPRCEPADCGTVNAALQTTNIAVKVPHPLRSGAGFGTREITVFFVKYDLARHLPIYSATHHDKFNYFNPQGIKLSRSNNFKQHPCPRLNGKQIDLDTYKGKQPFIRGHLTPYQAVGMLGHKSGDSSFLLINIAPQESWTNSAPWGNTVEDNTYCFLKKKGQGMVITGVCPGTLPGSSTNFPKPTCFWKLVCYKEKGETRVVGFTAPNSAIKASDKPGRRKAVIELKSQRQVIEEVTRSGAGRTPKFDFGAAWIEAGVKLIEYRDNGPNPVVCSRTLDLPPNFEAVWNKPSRRKKRSSGSIEYFGCNKSELDEFRALISSISQVDTSDGGENGDQETGGDGSGDGDDPGSAGSTQTFAGSSCGKRLIGYFPSWGTSKFTYVQGKSLTHVVFAFFETFADGSVRLGTADSSVSKDPAADLSVAKERLANFLRITKTFSHLKSMFAVGGWENSQYFRAIASDFGKRARFIASTLQILDQYGFDGIDIDWEHPVTGGAVEGVPADKENYVTLMKELRTALDEHASKKGRSSKFLISFAGAAGQWTLDPGLDLPKILQYADWANVMTYDYFGAWASKWGAYTGPPAPLYWGNPKGFSGKVNADWTIKYYTCKTKKPHQINMGVPFYGRFWENVGAPIDPADGMWRLAEQVNGEFKGGFVPWKEVKKTYLNDPQFKHEFHKKGQVPYAFNAARKIFLGYENPESLAAKVKYAEDFNLGGLMIWAIDQDDEDYTMLKTLLKADLCKVSDPSKIVHRCPPIDEKRWWTPEDGYDKAGMCGKSAPLYKGYYPLCDLDDPGYSCCGSKGYCGSGPEYCDCPTCIDYRTNPDKLLEEPIRPTVPVRWYISTDPDGKRGRCGRDVPLLGGQVPICNPDDPNSHCCSNGGYCGTGKQFCECEGCVDFKKRPDFVYKEKTWWSWADGEDKSGRCGPKAPKIQGKTAECDPDSKSPCCSPSGWCGNGADFCNCPGCTKYNR